MIKAVADTSGWYSFFVEKDTFHIPALEFIKTAPTLITPNTVFEELLAFLHHRQGKDIALKAAVAVAKVSLAGIHYISKNEDQEIMKVYKNTNKQIDYVDASVAWLARMLDLPILSFDSHFKKLGLKLVP